MGIGEARANAIDNAKKRAGEYAAAAGVAVGAERSPTPIETGTQDLTVSVTVVYEIT